jgi:hypothetical protein
MFAAARRCAEPYFAAAAAALAGPAGGGDALSLVYFSESDPAVLDAQPLFHVFADNATGVFRGR